MIRKSVFIVIMSLAVQSAFAGEVLEKAKGTVELGLATAQMRIHYIYDLGKKTTQDTCFSLGAIESNLRVAADTGLETEGFTDKEKSSLQHLKALSLSLEGYCSKNQSDSMSGSFGVVEPVRYKNKKELDARLTDISVNIGLYSKR